MTKTPQTGPKQSAKSPKQKLVIMVSSTVYGIEELLERVFAILTNIGYEVWMSHKGTVQVWPIGKIAFDNCLEAVEKCDLFLSIITTQYGSGKESKESLSITHQELLKAIDLNKPRWIIAHDHVPFTRSLLYNLGFKTAEDRAKLTLEKNRIIDDLRVVDMYELAIRHDISVHRDREGNWVQKYISPDDVLLFATAQFSRYQEIEKILEEQFADKAAVAKVAGKKVSS